MTFCECGLGSCGYCAQAADAYAAGHAEGYVAGAMEVTEKLHAFAAWLDGRWDEAGKRTGSYDDYHPGMCCAYEAALEYLEEMFRLPEQWEVRGPR